MHQIRTGQLIPLSAQQIVDCEHNHDSYGCNTGFTEDGYNYINQAGGLATEENYPLTMSESFCRDNPYANKVVNIKGWNYVPKYSEYELKKAVARQPVCAFIRYFGHAFRFYKSGIFDGPCDGQTNHIFLIVGYGTDEDGDYWLAKNSWGEYWGEDGYMRMRRGYEREGGLCGILQRSTYPY